jgi:hypothetical protein
MPQKAVTCASEPAVLVCDAPQALRLVLSHHHTPITNDRLSYRTRDAVEELEYGL